MADCLRFEDRLEEKLEDMMKDAVKARMKPLDDRAMQVWDEASLELKAWITTQGPLMQGQAGALEHPGKSYCSAVLLQRCSTFVQVHGWSGKRGHGEGVLDQACRREGRPVPVAVAKGKGREGKGPGGKGKGPAGKGKPWSVYPQGTLAGGPPIWFDHSLDGAALSFFGPAAQCRWNAASHALVEAAAQGGPKGKGAGKDALQAAALQALPDWSSPSPPAAAATPAASPTPAAASQPAAGAGAAGSSRDGGSGSGRATWSSRSWDEGSGSAWSRRWSRAWSSEYGYHWVAETAWYS